MTKTNRWKITVEPVEPTTAHTLVDLPADLTFAEVPQEACKEVLERATRLKQQEDEDWEEEMEDVVSNVDTEALTKLAALVADEMDFRKGEAEKASEDEREQAVDKALDEIPF